MLGRDVKIGRGERIRTSDPLVPNQVLYQAEPLPDVVAFAALPLRFPALHLQMNAFHYGSLANPPRPDKCTSKDGSRVVRGLPQIPMV